MKGSSLLKISGILLIIGGILTIITAVLGLNEFLKINPKDIELYKSLGGTDNLLKDMGVLKIVVYIALIGGVIQCFSGIICIVNSKKREKSRFLIILAVIIAVLSLIGNLLAMSVDAFVAISLIYGIAVPLIMILGAVKNKR